MLHDIVLCYDNERVKTPLVLDDTDRPKMEVYKRSAYQFINTTDPQDVVDYIKRRTPELESQGLVMTTFHINPKTNRTLLVYHERI